MGPSSCPAPPPPPGDRWTSCPTSLGRVRVAEAPCTQGGGWAAGGGDGPRRRGADASTELALPGPRPSSHRDLLGASPAGPLALLLPDSGCTPARPPRRRGPAPGACTAPHEKPRWAAWARACLSLLTRALTPSVGPHPRTGAPALGLWRLLTGTDARVLTPRGDACPALAHPPFLQRRLPAAGGFRGGLRRSGLRPRGQAGSGAKGPRGLRGPPGAPPHAVVTSPFSVASSTLPSAAQCAWMIGRRPRQRLLPVLVSHVHTRLDKHEILHCDRAERIRAVLHSHRRVILGNRAPPPRSKGYLALFFMKVLKVAFLTFKC